MNNISKSLQNVTCNECIWSDQCSRDEICEHFYNEDYEIETTRLEYENEFKRQWFLYLESCTY